VRGRGGGGGATDIVVAKMEDVGCEFRGEIEGMCGTEKVVEELFVSLGESIGGGIDVKMVWSM